jgi:hypothetical protein
MKKVSIKILGFIFAALILASCQKWINTDMNVNPDASVNVPISTILPAIQANMGYNTIGGSDICRVTALWTQQMQGIERQSLATTDYILREGDVNNQWNTDYAGTMMDLVQMMQSARAQANPYALAVGQILMANSLGICTDMWNDIPYSNAFKGQGDMAPVFDTQEQIYGTIQSLLDSAVTNLSQSGNWTIDGDMMYGGDPALWLKAAYAFKARYYLHLTEKGAPAAYANVLTVIDNAFTSNADDLQFNFGNSETFSNPLYQFMTQRGDITMQSYFIDMLLTRFDPRITVYATTDVDGGYSGNTWGGSSYDVSMPGSAVADIGSPVLFITFAECMFIKAEAELGTGVDEATVRTHISAGVAASMDKYGVLNPAYMAAYDSVLNTLSGPALFGELMTQKYIAEYYQAEAFNDWRRTGVPVLTPNPDGEPAGNPQIPRRFPYSTDEINYNKNCPVYGTIWDRVWWDTPSK